MKRRQRWSQAKASPAPPQIGSRDFLELYDEAIGHHQAGRLTEAENLYRQILSVDPLRADALHLLGVIAHQRGQYALAIEMITAAIAKNDRVAIFHSNLGNVLKARGQIDAAIASFERAVALKPDHVAALSDLGNLLQDRGRLNEAITCYERALVIKPDYAEARSNLGNTLKGLGRFDGAVACYEQALALKPNLPEALYNLGTVLQDQGKLGEAIIRYEQALADRPDFPQALANLGTALRDLGRLDEAIARYEQALAILPDFPEVLSNRGNVLQDQGRLDAAIVSYERALAIAPNYADALSNLANALKQQGRLDESIACSERALAIKPDHSDAYSNLLFIRAADASCDPRSYLALARGWEASCATSSTDISPASEAGGFHRQPLAGRRLRLGYVSGDFRDHAVSYFIEQLFAQHDRDQVELFAYTTSPLRDAVTVRLQALVDHWVPLRGLSDSAARARILADEIDVLIDLSGHTRGNRLGVFALRAAPVQAHYLGFFASTGLSQVDYWIGDEILTPPQTDEHFQETVWRLPRVWVSYDAQSAAPTPAWRPAADGSVWLGSFNNLSKLTQETIDLWGLALQALPEARLLLKTKALADAANRQRILDGLAARGVGASRIELLDHRVTPDWRQHMAYYDRLDVALDPVGGVGGGTTSCDALWMGVPVIALEGDRMATRMTASMLHAIGRPEWIARDKQDYVDKVVSLARDVQRRIELRRDQRVRMAASPLCDAHGLARALEQAFVAMLQRWREFLDVE